MRDLSRATGMSLAGLYHYFGSKERLLYLIQKDTFTTIIEQLKSRLASVDDPEERIRIFVRNHLEYFAANQSGLKVLAHEDEVLNGEFGAELAAIKRQYYRICVGLMDDLKRQRKLEFNSRTAVMSVFGMINWIYTWYNPGVDGPADVLARQMSDMVLQGVTAHGQGAVERRRASGRKVVAAGREGVMLPRTKRLRKAAHDARLG